MPYTFDELLAAADLLLKGGDVADALDMLNQAAARDPDHPEPYRRRAEITITAYPEDARAVKQAISDLKRARRLGGDSARLQQWIARGQLALGRDKAARTALARAQRLAPDDPRLLEQRIQLAYDAGDYDTALTLIDEAREALPPGETRASLKWLQLAADIMADGGSWQKAHDTLSMSALRHAAPEPPAPGTFDAPLWGGLYLRRVTTAYHVGEYKTAREALDHAAAWLPDDPALPLWRGLLAWAGGDADAAFPLLQAGLSAAGPAVRESFLPLLADYPRLTDLAPLLEKETPDDPA